MDEILHKFVQDFLCHMVYTIISGRKWGIVVAKGG